MEETLKLYSNREITIATFFGGPLAAGYLMKKNFLAMGDYSRAEKALLIGILATILLYVGIFSIPEPILDKIPKALIPTTYTAIISLLVNKLQGPFIKTHKENGGLFHSGWKAAGVGSVSMVILLVGIFSVVFLTGGFSVDPNFDAAAYDRETAKFTANEEKAMAVFKVLETSDPGYLKNEFERGRTLWKENREIILKLSRIKNLPEPLPSQNQKLLHYCDLRIQQTELILKSLAENTDKFLPDMNRIAAEIDQVIKELQ